LQQVQQRKRSDFKTFFAIQNPTEDLIFHDIAVSTICQRFKPNDRVLAKKEATKTAVIQKLSLLQAHCIHFHCHGTFDLQEPLESALLLANRELLTLGDIFGLHLDCCRLVTLSACETGQVDPTSTSDEYIGLPAGFLYAGANSVVSSLWKVQEDATAYLMIKFYENFLKDSSNTAKALNDAQRWLRDVSEEDFRAWAEKLSLTATQKMYIPHFLKNKTNPYYWAAFYATGQ
jgi:CHAT domain-containing protein